MVGESDIVLPTKKINENAKPFGKKTIIEKNLDPETKRSLNRENEAAESIAKSGYEIEQNPKVSDTSRNPDYKIEGKIFDCYSPSSNTTVRNIGSTISEKVITKKQTKRIVLNLNDWNGNVNDIYNQLTNYPIDGLKQVIVVKNGKVTSIYP